MGANVNKQDDQGCSPLHILASACCGLKQNFFTVTMSILRALLNHGADITLRDEEGLLAIDFLRRAEANTGDFMASFGIDRRQANIADTSQLKALLTPPNYAPTDD
jgi:Ankyrin repeat